MLKLLQRKLAKEGISVLTVLDELKHVYKLITSEGIEKTVATTKIQKKILKIKKLRNSGDYSTNQKIKHFIPLDTHIFIPLCQKIKNPSQKTLKKYPHFFRGPFVLLNNLPSGIKFCSGGKRDTSHHFFTFSFINFIISSMRLPAGNTS